MYFCFSFLIVCLLNGPAQFFTKVQDFFMPLRSLIQKYRSLKSCTSTCVQRSVF